MLKSAFAKEWVFLLMLGAVCSALLILQFRWAGELAAAERTQIASANRSRAETLGQAFDLELQAAAELVLSEIGNRSRDDEGRAVLAGVLAGKPVFKRAGVLQFESGEPMLRVWDRDLGEVKPDQLSGYWKEMAERRAGPPRPPPPGLFIMNDFIMEFPLGELAGRRDRSEPPEGVLGVLLEMDRSYVLDTWFPKLAQHYLGPDDERFPGLLVRGRSGEIIYEKSRAGAKASTVTVSFNKKGRSSLWNQGPPAEPVWRLEAAWPAGPVERMEARSRMRNFALGGSAIGLVFLSGLMLSRQAFRLRRISEERMRFVANVSHEFRTPLTVISGAAFNLKRGIVGNGDETRQYASLIMDHTDQLESLVNDVLDFSGSSSRSSRLRFSEVDVTKVLNAAVDDLAESMKPMKLDVVLTGIPSFVQGEESALRSIFRNLLDNAAKHAAAGGWIGVSIDFGATHVRLEFSDRGPGLSPREQKRVFEPFFRGRNSERTRGNGLGLALAREYARAHGGDITVGMGPGTGACFVVVLPTIPK